LTSPYGGVFLAYVHTEGLPYRQEEQERLPYVQTYSVDENSAGPRQRMVLNLGTDFAVPEEKWKDLANRIEQIATGQDSFVPYRRI